MHPSQIGPYRIVKLLGAGGMGVVYEALQEPIQRRVALKLLLPQFAQHNEALTRFFNEACVVNLIEHPSIVQVSDYGQTPDGAAFLVMECLRGESLSTRLKALHGAGQRLPFMDALHIAAQVADALTAAHDKEVVHRDLKPANIMLVRDPVAPGGERAKILDFGIAKLTQGQGSETAANAVIGTPQYMSPEQCRGAGGVDDRTDVYALGVMLYEMLAGRTPFLGSNGIDYMAQHSFDEPPPLRSLAPTVPPEIAEFIHGMLVKNKVHRPTMRSVATELARLTRPQTGSQLPALSPQTGMPMTGAIPSALGMPMQQLPPMQQIQQMQQLQQMQQIQQMAPLQQMPQMTHLPQLQAMPPSPMSQPMMLVSSAALPAVSPMTMMPGASSTLGVSGQTLPPPPPRRSRRVLAAIGAGVGILTVLVVFGSDWFGTDKPPPPKPAAPPRVSTSKPSPPRPVEPIEDTTEKNPPAAKPVAEKPSEVHARAKTPVAPKHPPVSGPRRVGGPATRGSQSNSSPPPGKKLIPVED